MTYLNRNKKSRSMGTAAKVLSLATILVVAIGAVNMAPLTVLGSTEVVNLEDDKAAKQQKAPTVVSGDNIYIAWWTNNTSENGNQEVMFRASTDRGATFSNSTNLSNTTDADSWRVEIAGEGDTVVVSWWETNQTSDIPVARISTDAGETFGPMIMLGMNGTVSGVEGGEGGAATAATAEGGEDEGEEDEGEEEVTAEGVIEEAVE